MSTRTVRGARIFRFGDFELHVRAAEVRRGGERIRLQEQPYRILLMMLEHPGEVVLREEIRKRLWPNDTVVEISHGINAAVLRLREALGESAEDPRHIETVARRGYRFRGEVEVVYQQGQAVRPAAPGFDTGSLTGQTLSHFRVMERLGVGGMGVVYRAEDLKLGRQVALKFLPPELAGDAVALKRFEREARTASVLNHPNVCTVYSVEECGGQPAIVMELLEGDTLEARLKDGPMPLAEGLSLAIAIAGAMEAAHRKGIVHRDLKPANVVVTTTGVKVLDFGLAKTARAANVTLDGAILGTPNYMAPEQMLAQEAGAQSDIYSFGVMLREMLGAAADPSLQRVIARCLEREPENRWHSAGDLKAALEMIAPVERVSRPAHVFRVHLPLPTARAAATAAVCIALVAGSVVWRPFGRTPTRLTIPAPAAIPVKISVSPDGERVAYSGAGRIWVRALGEADAHPVDGTDGGGAPFWSPDGKYLGFTAGKRIRKVAATGGIAQTLCDVNTAIAGMWGSSGEILIGQIGDGIFRVHDMGGELVRVTHLDPMKNEARHMLPQFLPGGRRFLYVAAADRMGYSVLYAASLDSPERTALMNVESGVVLVNPRRGTRGYLVFVQDRALMAQSFDTDTLERKGPARLIAPAVATTPSQGSPLLIGDFAAAGSTLAYRLGASSPINLVASKVLGLPGDSPARSAGEITVLRNWM